MKTTLTIEESARLIELGVNAKLASEVMIDYIDPYDIDDAIERKNPIFTLTDLLSILPKEIKYSVLTYGLNIWVQDAVWNVEYGAEKGVYDFLTGSSIEASELIDALNQLLIWCIKNGHYNPKK